MNKKMIETKVGDIAMQSIIAEPDGYAEDKSETILCLHGFPDNLYSFDK